MSILTRHKYHTIVSTAIFAVLTASCFTGIESTPKITADDVKRQVAPLSDEDCYLSDIAPQRITDWQPGKEFYVTDEKIGLATTISPATHKLSAGDTLRFQSVADVTSILGEPAAEVIFNGPAGTTVTYRSDKSIETLSTLNGVTIPFTVELSIVAQVRDKMLDKEYWITTSEWLDTARRPRRGRKFVKVKVIGVDRGDDTYPVCLTLTDFERQPADTLSLLMTIGDGISSSRRFPSLFSLDNPHSRYPAITPSMWTLICNGKVTEGMTREEVRLSLGRPVNVDRRAGYSTLGEIWTYENGIYLIFEDGLLKQYRM